MKRKNELINRKNKLIGFILLIIFCFNFAAFFNIDFIRTNVTQNIPNDEVITKTSSVPSDFSYYKTIVIDHHMVEGSENLVNFPMLISIIDSDLKSHGVTDPNDIAFFKGMTQLDHEIESYNYYYSDTQVQLIAWVRIPELSCVADTIIRMHYYAGSLGSQENKEGVWDNDYKAVWHLSENPTGYVYDSTVNPINGNPASGMNSQNQVAGKISNAIYFSGASDNYIDFSSYDDAVNSITVSFWMKAGATKHMRLIDNYPDDSWSSNPIGWSIRTEYVSGTPTTGGPMTFIIGSDYYNSLPVTTSTNPDENAYTKDKWVYVACTYDGSTARVYINGNEEASRGGYTSTYNIANNDEYLRFGKPRKVETSLTFTGALDEVQISDIARSSDWITTEFRNQDNPTNYYTVSEEFNFTTTLGVSVGDKYIYQVVEKDTDLLGNNTLDEMHAFVNATAWFVVLNETKDMPNYQLEDRIWGPDVYVTPIHFYFERNVYTSPYNGQTYSVSAFLSDPAFFDPPYPPVKGISEWYSDTYNRPTDLKYGTLYNEGYPSQYWICKIIDGTTHFPGLVADNELGQGVLDFLDLYDRAVAEAAQGNNTLKNQMISEYGISSQGSGSSYISAWGKFDILVQYYRDYWVPIAMPMVWPLVKERKPQVEYMDVLDKVVSSPEVKGEFTCYEIKNILNTLNYWNITIDQWNYTFNKDDFDNTNASNSFVVQVFKDSSDLGVNITVARLTLMDQDVMPMIVDLHLGFVNWFEDVVLHGDTVYELLYSDPAEFDEIEIGDTTYYNIQVEELNLTYSITYDNNGMIKTTTFYADALTELFPFPIRKTIYELSLYHEEDNPSIPGDNGGGNNDIPKFLGMIDYRIIILSSFSIIFGIAFLIVIKKPRGYRR